MSTLDYTPWQLAREAGVTEPDNMESPGAVFLLEIQTDVNALDHDELDEDDGPYQVADGVMPYATYTIWQTFVDLCLWDWDDEIGDTGDDLTATAQSYLFQVARSLAYSLIRERLDGDAPDEEDDDA